MTCSTGENSVERYLFIYFNCCHFSFFCSDLSLFSCMNNIGASVNYLYVFFYGFIYTHQLGKFICASMLNVDCLFLLVLRKILCLC